jgi:copper oxidase (laccase) domain-containing protein
MISNITFEAPLLRGRFIVFNSHPDFDFLKVKQTHSDLIIPEDKCAVEVEGDGIIGNNDVPKVILTADCVPIVLLGKDKHVVIHAGWRGLAQNILANELVKSIIPTYAYIGPHIRPEHYEVQADFLSHFPNFPEAFTEHHGKICFNMELVATRQLVDAYPGIVVEDCGLCTFSNLVFHSYRRDKTTQRNWNIYFPK